MNISVTIIVPIYNAFEDTQNCLKSVLEHTDSKHKVLLIDDASPDKRIAELTRHLSLEYPHIKLLTNSLNLGFVKTCNRAFMESEQTDDVVILNSDTIVTPNWLEKLADAAYSSIHIGTVTPLTNNGTICSVPTWLESNEIPEGQTILSFANLIEKISFRKYPRIPTAVGFCTYIKREVFKKIGYFDDINFSRGYGEENDFCCRAEKSGYFHIIDDATFVYHAGSKSFKSDKQKLIEENSKILAKLHSRYFPQVHTFIQVNPLKDILDNIELHLNIEKFKGLSPICFILHNSIHTPINHPLGGTEYHCAALISSLSQTRPVYNLYCNRSQGLIEFEIFYKEQKFNFKFKRQFQAPYNDNYFHHDAKFLRTIVGILQYFQPSLIHIHHLIGLPLADIVSAIKQLDIPYILSLHDYYLICPSYNLIDYKEKFCFEQKNPNYCKNCVQELFHEGEELKQQWSVLCQQLLEGATTVVVPSQTALSYFLREYPLLKLEKKSKIIRHGIFKQDDLINIKNKNNIQKSNSDCNSYNYPLKIALVGSINVSKGSKIFVSLLEKINQQKLSDNFVFEIIGRFNLILPPQIQNVKLGNEYSKNNLDVLLENIDVAIFPNIWAETYCLTVDEVIAHGIPVITTPLSAASERVTEFEAGWVSNAASADELLKTLIYIKNNYAEFKKIKKNIMQYPLVSYEEMFSKYEYEYSQNHKTWTDSETQPIISPKEILDAEAFNYYQCLPVSQQEQVEMQKLQLMIRAMETSKLWKLRIAWFRVKQSLGLAFDDLWTKERGASFQYPLEGKQLLFLKLFSVFRK